MPPTPPTLRNVRIRSPEVARRIILAVIDGDLPAYPGRLEPGLLLKPGDVFVFQQRADLKRWTDGLTTSSSRAKWSKNDMKYLHYIISPGSLVTQSALRMRYSLTITSPAGQAESEWPWELVAYDYEKVYENGTDLRDVSEIEELRRASNGVVLAANDTSSIQRSARNTSPTPSLTTGLTAETSAAFTAVSEGFAPPLHLRMESRVTVSPEPPSPVAPTSPPSPLFPTPLAPEPSEVPDCTVLARIADRPRSPRAHLRRFHPYPPRWTADEEALSRLDRT